MIDFDFGNLAGALLLYVEYKGAARASTLSGSMEVGLHFNGSQPAPGTSLLFNADRNVFGYSGIDWSLTTSGVCTAGQQNIDLRPYDMFIAGNPAIQCFMSGASTLSVSCSLYFKRVRFSEAEVGGVIAFRR